MKILAVDISNLFRRNWEASQGKEFSEAHNRTVQAVARFREGHDRVAICCDGGRSFRKSISSQYKADRTDPGEAYREQLRRTIDRLKADGCSVFLPPQLGEEGYAEADDIMGSLCTWAREFSHSVSIVSADKDILQCVTSAQDEPKVCRITPDKGEAQFAETVIEKLGVQPTQIPEWLALCGDKSDGYKPYPGLGEKGAAELLKALGSLAVILLHTEEAKIAEIINNKTTAKTIKDLGPDPGFEALRLATLRCDLALDFAAIEAEPARAAIAPQAQQPFVEPAKPAPTALAPAPPEQQKTQALAAAKPSNSIDRTALQPRSLRQLGELARVVVESRMFPNIATQEQAYVVMHMANEHGVPAMTAMQHAYFVRGRLAWSAQYISGLCLRSPLCQILEVVETTATHCLVKYKRTGRPEREYRVTFEEAKTQGWVKAGSKWQESPRTMLRWCALRETCRFVWPEIVGGLYTPDELRDGEITDAEFAQAEAA